MKKIISIIITFAILISTIAISSSAKAKINSVDSVNEALSMITENPACDGECGYSPLIIVPGIMQSQVYVQDNNGHDLLTSDGFPIVEGMDMSFMFDTKAIESKIPSLIISFLKALFLRDRDVFLDDFIEVMQESFQSHYFNPDGTRVNDVQVDEYWYSYEECMKVPDKSYGYAKGYSTDENGNALPSYKYEHQYDFIRHQVDITGYTDKAGFDHAYYFTYSSFGDTLSIAEKLSRYVEMVKEQTGHSKVNIVFISLGGTIGNTYLAKYCNPDDIDRIIFAAAAVDGSKLLGDLMGANFALDDPSLLYNSFIPELLKIAGMDNYVWAGYLANTLLRIIPNSVFSDLLQYSLNRVILEVLGGIVQNCPSMWALVPSDNYEELAERFISDDAHKVLKAKTDEYYNIQKNAGKTIQKLTNEGMDIFVVCGYDLALPSVIDSWNYSSDNIIHAQSTSFGATFAKAGGTLSDEYIANANPKYISPDRAVDASTAALPDRTWFIKGQSHLKLQSAVHDCITMCMNIMIDKNITDAIENNGGYAQFNEYRDLKEIESMIRSYNSFDLSTLDSDTLENVKSKYNKVIDVYESKAWDSKEALKVEKEFYDVLQKAGIISGDSAFVTYDIPEFINSVAKAQSDILAKLYGNRDFYTSARRFR